MEGSDDSEGSLQPVTTDLSLEGAETGVIRIPYAIPAAWQGRIMIYDVYADSAYPKGRGEVVRSARGHAVDALRSPLGETLRRAALLAVHHAKLRNASLELRLPIDVAERIPPGVSIEMETLWGAKDEVPQESGQN
jgi:hypothetical protein